MCLAGPVVGAAVVGRGRDGRRPWSSSHVPRALPTLTIHSAHGPHYRLVHGHCHPCPVNLRRRHRVRWGRSCEVSSKTSLDDRRPKCDAGQPSHANTGCPRAIKCLAMAHGVYVCVCACARVCVSRSGLAVGPCACACACACHSLLPPSNSQLRIYLLLDSFARLARHNPTPRAVAMPVHSATP